MMNGLRVYVNQLDTNTLTGQEVFYSRREEGPYYLWRYEEQVGVWRFFRLHTSDLMRKALCTAKWNVVPTALQTKLKEHYLVH